MAIQRVDPFAVTRNFWRFPNVLDDDWFDVSYDQGLSVYETDNDVVVEANVAGVPEDKVEVSIEGGTVTIKAEHKETEEDKKKKKVVYRQARSAQYLYSTSLPSPVDANKANAEITNGILKLTVPKKEEAKPKKITVKASDNK